MAATLNGATPIGPGLQRRRRALLAALAALVGLLYSFPHWVWHFTSPDYSIVRGYILSDDDMAPYAAALRDAVSHPLPPLAAFHRSFETRERFSYPVLSLWLTNLLLGAALRMAGSLELLVPLGLFLSGAATFYLAATLARRLTGSGPGALVIAALICFRYPFYISIIAAGRRLLETGGDLAGALRAAFPGMANGYMLYPYVRWPVPGMVFWWFLLALLMLAGLARATEPGRGRPFPLWAAVGAGIWIGLSAYIYFFFWSYLVALLGVLLVLAWLRQRRRLAAALLWAGCVAGIVSAPFGLSGAAQIGSGRLSVNVEEATNRTNGTQVLALNATEPAPGQPAFETLLAALSTHGLLAFAVVLGPGLRAGAAPGPQPGNGAIGAEDQRSLLFAMHLTVVLLAAVEALGFRALQAWHWSRHLIDCFAPLSVGWLLVGQARLMGGGASRPAARWTTGVAGLAVLLAVFTAVAAAGQPAETGGAGATARTVAALALLVPGLIVGAMLSGQPGALRLGRNPRLVWLALSAGVCGAAWYFFHRSMSEMSWLALLPLGVWAAAERPRVLGRAAGVFAVLNVALAAALQLAVRPAAARPFFTQAPEITEALRWLDANTPRESVVATNGWLGDSVVRAYTHNLTYTQPLWWTSVGNSERHLRRLLRAAMYATPPALLEQWAAERAAIIAEFKTLTNEQWVGDSRIDLLAEEQAAPPDDLAAYAVLYAWPLEDLLQVYRVDYIWVGPWEGHTSRRDFAAEPALRLVYENAQVRIYEVK